jgi:hypothetical protein
LPVRERRELLFLASLGGAAPRRSLRTAIAVAAPKFELRWGHL